jgi:hypothetical protein
MSNFTGKLTAAWFTPVFSTVLQKRMEVAVLAGAGVLQVGLHLAGLPGWACPFKGLFGIPCPGCGLTTATGQLLRGQFSASIHTHAFAGVFLGAFCLLAFSLLLPQKSRLSMADWIARFEQRTGMTALILVTLMAYWIVRLAGLV